MLEDESAERGAGQNDAADAEALVTDGSADNGRVDNDGAVTLAGESIPGSDAAALGDNAESRDDIDSAVDADATVPRPWDIFFTGGGRETGPESDDIDSAVAGNDVSVNIGVEPESDDADGNSDTAAGSEIPADVISPDADVIVPDVVERGPAVEQDVTDDTVSVAAEPVAADAGDGLASGAETASVSGESEPVGHDPESEIVPQVSAAAHEHIESVVRKTLQETYGRYWNSNDVEILDRVVEILEDPALVNHPEHLAAAKVRVALWIRTPQGGPSAAATCNVFWAVGRQRELGWISREAFLYTQGLLSI